MRSHLCNATHTEHMMMETVSDITHQEKLGVTK